jgi:outer membrane protein assembly factor BamD (BamD/ComL family)
MKNLKLFLAASIALVIASCGHDQTKTTDQPVEKGGLPAEQYMAQIKQLETEMHKSPELKDSTALLAVQTYSDYAKFYPNDTISPDYLFKAAEISTGLKKYKQSLEFYQTITSKYPSFKYIKESLYLQAFLLDNFLNDDAGAKTIYEEVISKYPDSNYAKDAKSAIGNLGKTDEQLIQEFQKKNGKK